MNSEMAYCRALHSLGGRALHRYRRGHGFESRRSHHPRSQGLSCNLLQERPWQQGCGGLNCQLSLRDNCFNCPHKCEHHSSPSSKGFLLVTLQGER